MRSEAGGGEQVNLSVNGQSKVPPGFRFHPTEEELLHYYLRKKVASEKIDLDVIREVDLNKLEPWDIQERCKIGSTPQNDWYFFSHKDKKYPTGTRTNRATAAGFWKATGRDKIIYSGLTRIGLRKTLVFYKGRAPHGQKSDWIMHEYRLDDATTPDTPPPPPPHINGMIMSNVVIGEGGSEEGWVVCRVFRKKNYQKSLESPRSSSGNSSSSILHHHHMDSKSHILMNSPSAARYGGSTDGVLDQILMYMGRRNATTTSTSTSNSTTCKAENDYSSFSMGSSISSSNTNIISGVVGGEGGFIHLPRLVVDQQQQHQQQQSFGDEAMLTSENNNNNDNYNAINNNETSSAKQGTEFDVTPVYRTGRGGGGNGMIVNDWVALDRLVASQLNGHLHNDVVDGNDNDDDHEDMQMEDEQFRSILNHVVVPAGERQQHQLIYSSECERENDIWTNFNNHSSSSPSSSSDPLCHLSV